MTLTTGFTPTEGVAMSPRQEADSWAKPGEPGALLRRIVEAVEGIADGDVAFDTRRRR